MHAFLCFARFLDDLDDAGASFKNGRFAWEGCNFLRQGIQKHATGLPKSPERHVYVCMHSGLFAAVFRRFVDLPQNLKSLGRGC